MNAQHMMFWSCLPLPFCFLLMFWADATKYYLPLTTWQVTVLSFFSMVGFVTLSLVVAAKLHHPAAFGILFISILVPFTLASIPTQSVLTEEEKKRLAGAKLPRVNK